MATFIIDTDGVRVLTGRLRVAAEQGEESSARIRRALELADLPPAEADTLDRLTNQWRLASRELNDRAEQFDAGEITLEDLADVDLGEDLLAVYGQQARDALDAQIAGLMADTPPVIEEGYVLERTMYNHRIGPDEYEWRHRWSYVDGDGDRHTVDYRNGQGLIEIDGETYPVVVVNGEPTVIVKGQTGAERVAANLVGQGDGTTPSFEDILATSLGDVIPDDITIPIPGPGDSKITVEIERDGTSLEEVFVRVKVGKLPNPEDYLDDGFKDWEEFAEAMADVLGWGDTYRSWKGWAEGYVDQAWDATKSQFNDLMEATGLDDAWDSVSDFMEEAWDSTVDAVEDAWDGFSDAVGDAWDSIFGGDDTGTKQDDREGSGGITDAEKQEFGGPAEDYADSNGLL